MESLSHLTMTDREILNKSWAIVMKDMQQVSVNIFQMIFEQAPDAKLMFSFMMKDYKEDKKSNEFIFHAVRFIQVIESTMTHLDDPSQLDAVFLNLGKIHARHEEQLGFSAHYWSVFKECTLFHFRRAMKADKKLFDSSRFVEGRRRTIFRFSKKSEMSFAEIDAAIILWREVLRFIIDKMKVGYCENGLIRKANKQAINGHSSSSPTDCPSSAPSFPSGTHSVENKHDLTQVSSLAAKHRMARHSVAVIRENAIHSGANHRMNSTSGTDSTNSSCGLLETIASLSPKCVRRRFSVSPNSHAL